MYKYLLKFILLSIVSLLFNQDIYSQLPLKKDSASGTKEIIKLMAINGFTLNKKEWDYQKPPPYRFDPHWRWMTLIYREEFTVDISYNDFNNISCITIKTGNYEIIDKLKKIIEFDRWEYFYTVEGGDSVYKLYNYSARYIYHPDWYNSKYKNFIHQFIMESL